MPVPSLKSWTPVPPDHQDAEYFEGKRSKKRAAESARNTAMSSQARSYGVLEVDEVEAGIAELGMDGAPTSGEEGRRGHSLCIITRGEQARHSFL